MPPEIEGPVIEGPVIDGPDIAGPDIAGPDIAGPDKDGGLPGSATVGDGPAACPARRAATVSVIMCILAPRKQRLGLIRRVAWTIAGCRQNVNATFFARHICQLDLQPAFPEAASAKSQLECINTHPAELRRNSH